MTAQKFKSPTGKSRLAPRRAAGKRDVIAKKAVAQNAKATKRTKVAKRSLPVSAPSGPRFAYAAVLADDGDGRVLVTFPDFPEAATDGADTEEALREASDCLEEAIASRIAHSEDLPAPGRIPRQAECIPVPAVMAAKAALYLAMSDAGMSKTKLAASLGCDEKEVRRMLDPRHNTRIDRIERVLAAFGKALEVRLIETPVR